MHSHQRDLATETPFYRCSHAGRFSNDVKLGTRESLGTGQGTRSRQALRPEASLDKSASKPVFTEEERGCIRAPVLPQISLFRVLDHPELASIPPQDPGVRNTHGSRTRSPLGRNLGD